MPIVDRISYRDYHRNYYYKRRAALIAYLGDSCVWCGTKDDLQFDHIDPDLKSFDISSNMTANNPAVRAELDKCQLLCRGCHLEKTRQEHLEIGFRHGHMYAWMKRGCRCELCVAAREEYNAKRRADRRSSAKRGVYGRPANHGEILMYRRGCKCELCRKANAEYARSLRDKNAA